jgi:hypothetical protein
MNCPRTILATLVGALLVAAVQPTVALAAPADGFRIDSSVRIADQKGPPTESTTIFSDGVVYDYMTAPAETVVFEQFAGAGRFILLNLKSRTRAELTTNEVAAFTDHLQQSAARRDNPLAKFLAAPKFQESFNETTGELSLTSPLVTYRLTLGPAESPAAMEQYHEFSDWYARLNALLKPGAPPPFARLVVNAALAQRNATPSQVVLTLAAGKSNRQPITIHSTHRVVRPLPPADLDRVAKTRESMARFKLVGFDQYRKQELR